jgi:hypothetical protein
MVDGRDADGGAVSRQSLLVDFLTSSPNNDTEHDRQDRPDVVLYNPADNPPTIKLIWDDADPNHPGFPNNHMLYCSGHCQLADGRVLFRGGNTGGPGNAKTTICVSFHAKHDLNARGGFA